MPNYGSNAENENKDLSLPGRTSRRNAGRLFYDSLFGGPAPWMHGNGIRLAIFRDRSILGNQKNQGPVSIPVVSKRFDRPFEYHSTELPSGIKENQRVYQAIHGLYPMGL
jgi:hypothetical protein